MGIVVVVVLQTVAIVHSARRNGDSMINPLPLFVAASVVATTMAVKCIIEMIARLLGASAFKVKIVRSGGTLSRLRYRGLNALS